MADDPSCLPPCAPNVAGNLPTLPPTSPPPPPAAARFETTIVDVIPGSPALITPGTNLVHWSVFSRTGTNNTLLMNNVTVNVPLSSTLSSQTVTQDGGTLIDVGVATAGLPASRMTLVLTRRVP